MDTIIYIHIVQLTSRAVLSTSHCKSSTRIHSPWQETINSFHGSGNLSANRRDGIQRSSSPTVPIKVTAMPWTTILPTSIQF